MNPITPARKRSLFTATLFTWLTAGLCFAATQPPTLVRVGNAGNAADQPQGDPPLQFGAVGYEYEIGKFKVTVAEYAEFLNARGASDPNGLYNEGMEITREGEDGSYTYTVQEGKARRPIRWVEPVDGMRYANWLHNGALNTSDTETGAYTFADPLTPGPRNPGAKYFLPSENEWYKAAYYDPAKDGTGGYWLFAVRADEALADLPPGGPHSANFDAVNRDDGETTDVGAYASAASYYGTFDQTGNTWEWLEPDPETPDMSRRRSGSWENAVGRLASDQTGVSSILVGATQHQGFRIAAPVGELEPIRLTIKRTADGVEISWIGGGKLYSQGLLAGLWSLVSDAPSPITVRADDASRFYRVTK